MSSGKLVLVTGVTGFIAGQVADAFLEAGYRVRGTARGAKTQQLMDTIHVTGLEFVQVDDLASSDLTEALKGVYAVIHVASPLAGMADVEETLKSAVDGTLHVMKETVKAGIERMVITSSFGVNIETDLSKGYTGEVINGSEWGTVPDEIKDDVENPRHVYFASKILAERAVWDFVEQHPQLDVATILPAFVFGPFSKHFPPLPPSQGTNSFIYTLMIGGKPPMNPPCFVDVRDVAKAHVNALNVPRKPLEHKRYLAVSGLLTWPQAAAYIREVRPGLKTLHPDEFDALPGRASTYDTSKTQQELGIKFHDYKETLPDTVDALLEAENIFGLTGSRAN